MQPKSYELTLEFDVVRKPTGRFAKARTWAALVLISLASRIAKIGASIEQVEVKPRRPAGVIAPDERARRKLGEELSKPLAGGIFPARGGFELVPGPSFRPAIAGEDLGPIPEPGPDRPTGCRSLFPGRCHGDAMLLCRECSAEAIAAYRAFNAEVKPLGLPQQQRQELGRVAVELAFDGKNPRLVRGADGGYAVGEAEPEVHQLATWEDDGGRPGPSDSCPYQVRRRA